MGELYLWPRMWTPLPVPSSRLPVDSVRVCTHAHTHTHTQTLGLHHSSSPRDSSSSPAVPPVCAPISPPFWLHFFCPVCPLVDRTAVSQTEAEQLLLCGGGGTGWQSTAAFWGLVGHSFQLCAQAPHSFVHPFGKPVQLRVGPQ